VPGRILQTPQLQYRGTSTVNPRNGAWNLDPRQLGKEPFRVARRLPSWNTVIINSGGETINGGMSEALRHLGEFRNALNTYNSRP
jgi:eukaryotic translation initiation factor 2C